MKNYNKYIAGVLAVLLSAGATGSIAYAKNSGEKKTADTKNEETADEDKDSRKSNGKSAFKDETVYVLCNSDSSVKNVVVSDWLKNAPALSDLTDISSLSNIENVKGWEDFTANGEKLKWSADGNDIYYKGTSDKELPVDVDMSYYLDGKKVAPEDIKGKSGHLVIKWNYTNKQRIVSEVNGEKKKQCVPFMTASAAVLSTDKFVNVEVKNGKVISDGDKLIVVGMAFPGLNGSLGLDSIEGLDVDIPESFEIEADVTDFEMASSVTVVSNDIFSQLDIDGTSSFDELKDKLGQLSDGAEKLADGTAALYDGIKQLSDGSGDLTDGIDKLLSGSGELKNGADQLADGSVKLGDGAKTLSDGAAALAGGLKDAKDGSSALASGAEQVNEGSAALCDGIVSAKDGSAQLSSGLGQLSNGAKALGDGISSAKEGSDALTAGFTQVQDGASQLKNGAAQLTGGVSQLTDGSTQVKNGSASLAEGASALSGGASRTELHSSAKA